MKAGTHLSHSLLKLQFLTTFSAAASQEQWDLWERKGCTQGPMAGAPVQCCTASQLAHLASHSSGATACGSSLRVSQCPELGISACFPSGSLPGIIRSYELMFGSVGAALKEKVPPRPGPWGLQVCCFPWESPGQAEWTQQLPPSATARDAK